MTRINCIDPELLSDKHLGAEYRELPRIFGLVRAAQARGEAPSDPRNPKQYTLGKGHCRFFYPRLAYLKHRYRLLVEECQKRGRKVSYPVIDDSGIDHVWFNHWYPIEADKALNIERINARGGLRTNGTS